MHEDSLGQWLIGRIHEVLARNDLALPVLLWCDPNREWHEILQAIAEAGSVELWADPTAHELMLRDRLFQAEPTPRVIWLPCSREEITWLKVYELEARGIWESSLLEAIREYGVRIPREYEDDLIPLLPAHACEWLDKPRETWEELTPTSSKGTLVSDQRMLEILAGAQGQFQRLDEEERFGIFSRRATEDFGFPDPTNMAEPDWRIAATACLLATEAAEGCPENPPSEGDYIIPSGTPRDNAMRLLNLWRNHVQFLPSFESLTQEADKLLGLTYWAKNLSEPPRSQGSPAVERALFDKIADEFDRIEDVEELTQVMERRLPAFQERGLGFWGSTAVKRIGWRYLTELAETASLIVENSGIEDTWQSAEDAVDWYIHRGWLLDQAGESLFVESPGLPHQLTRIRSRLQRAYLRRLDHIGRAFSELLCGYGEQVFSRPTAGEILLKELNQSKTPTAVVYLDALSLQLGHRLAAMLNEGEPEQRASVEAAIAPVPSITALGMAFALPIERTQLRVEYLANGKRFDVRIGSDGGDLAKASSRREWLTSHLGAKEFLRVSEILDSGRLKAASRSRNLVVVEGSEFDREGHEGQLQLTGANEHLERYAQAIRKLQNAGYHRILVATDHGFFHWQPEADEIVDSKPDGEILWSSRRAIVGHALKHEISVRLPVLCSNLEVMIPRSVNAFRTYGGLGYFHGGATLQELIIPVIIAQWPVKATKTPVVLKPVEQISTEIPRIQVEAGMRADQGTLFPDSSELSRRVLVKVRDADSGKLVFRHENAVTIEPGGQPVTVQMQLVEPRPTIPYGTLLVVEVLDADDEELLAREEVTARVDIDEW